MNDTTLEANKVSIKMQGKTFGYVTVGGKWVASVTTDYIEAVREAVEKKVKEESASTFNSAKNNADRSGVRGSGDEVKDSRAAPL